MLGFNFRFVHSLVNIVVFKASRNKIREGVCETTFFYFETETVGCWYQESRLRLRLFTMVSKIETETKTFHFGLKS